MVCFGTLYIYGAFFILSDQHSSKVNAHVSASKKTSKKSLIIGIISLSYSTYVVTTCVAWYLVKIAFINNGVSQEAVFTAIYTSPHWAYLLTDIRIFLNAALADGLLVRNPICFAVELTYANHFPADMAMLQCLGSLISGHLTAIISANL